MDRLTIFIRRLHCLPVVFLAVALSTIPASQAENAALTVPEELKGGKLRLALARYPEHLRRLGPGLSDNTLYTEISAIQLSLISVADDETITGLLATHWESRPDHVCFTLHPDARWSDDKPVTAADLVFTAEFILSGKALTPVLQNTLNKHIKSVYAPDERTFCAQAKTENDPQLFKIVGTIQPLAKHAYQTLRNWPDAFDWYSEPTTGPYHIARIHHGHEIVFSYTEDWWGAKLPAFRDQFNLSQISYSLLSDPFAAFSNGELDLVAIPDDDRALNQFQRLATQQKISLLSIDTPATGVYGLIVNGQRPVLSKVAQRHRLQGSLTFTQGNMRSLLGEHYPRPAIEEKSDISVSLSYADLTATKNLKKLQTDALAKGIQLTLSYYPPSVFKERLSLGQFELAYLSFEQPLSGAGLASLFSPDAGSIYIANPGIPAYLLTSSENESNKASDLADYLFRKGLYIDLTPEFSTHYFAFWEWLNIPQQQLTTDDPISMDPLQNGRLWINRKDRADILAQPTRRHNEPINFTRIQRHTGKNTTKTELSNSES